MSLRKYLPGKLGKKDTLIPAVRLAGAIASGGGPYLGHFRWPVSPDCLKKHSA